MRLCWRKRRRRHCELQADEGCEAANLDRQVSSQIVVVKVHSLRAESATICAGIEPDTRF